jgi:hypothetical protein
VHDALRSKTVVVAASVDVEALNGWHLVFSFDRSSAGAASYCFGCPFLLLGIPTAVLRNC